MVRVLGAVLLNMPTLPERDFWTTTVPEFEREMAYLAENGYVTIGLDELADWMDGHGEIPPKAVVLTIDDGDISFAQYAVPVLRRYGFRATVFLLTGRAGETGWNELNFADWETLRELEREGVIRVESHTHRMHTKVMVDGQPVPRFLLAAFDSTGAIGPDSRLVQDLRASRATMRRELGHEPSFLAWPFGFGDAVVDSVAHTLGFRRVLTLRAERNLPDFQGEAGLHDDGLGRYAMTARTSFRLFERMVARAEEAREAIP
jgi:peptidoglycan/xylan/chitin deacetylase (PgdA/CDA1 family)